MVIGYGNSIFVSHPNPTFINHIFLYTQTPPLLWITLVEMDVVQLLVVASVVAATWPQSPRRKSQTCQFLCHQSVSCFLPWCISSFVHLQLIICSPIIQRQQPWSRKEALAQVRAYLSPALSQRTVFDFILTINVRTASPCPVRSPLRQGVH